MSNLLIIQLFYFMRFLMRREVGGVDNISSEIRIVNEDGEEDIPHPVREKAIFRVPALKSP